MENRGDKRLLNIRGNKMNIYNLLFGRSPCHKCVVKAICNDSECDRLNNWVSDSIRKVKVFGIVIKTGTIVGLVSLTGVKMSSDYVNFTINPVIVAGAVVIFFLSYPTLDFIKFKMLSHFNFKGRLNEHNREIYIYEQTGL